ncbi:MAG: glutamate-cysteine ligase family protein [Methanoregulaceae archaeon]|nr:glutamate-cysteine ligase family protein [Methanoregulaceae archaeon]
MLIGTEHEYSINSPDLSPRPESDRILAELAGSGSSQAPFGSVQLSKELQKTVIEVVPDHPAPTVRELEEMVSRGTERFSRKFGDRYRLLGLGMHPALRLSETAVWDQEEQDYYEVYDRIFGLSQHGWLNIQSLQVNLSYADEGSMVATFNRLRSLLPFLAAVSAASPFVEGAPSGSMDSRLLYYRENQRQIPGICNGIIPGLLHSREEYGSWLGEMYRKLRQRGGSVLCEEWVASYGVIIRFSRPCVELKVMDEQECVRSDMALCAFIRALLRANLPGLESDRRALLELTGQAIARGTAALRPELLRLFRMAERHAAPDERPYLPIIRDRIVGGSLAELLMNDWRDTRDLPAIMAAAASCLRTNTPYHSGCS